MSAKQRLRIGFVMAEPEQAQLYVSQNDHPCDECGVLIRGNVEHLLGFRAGISIYVDQMDDEFFAETIRVCRDCATVVAREWSGHCTLCGSVATRNGLCERCDLEETVPLSEHVEES